MKAPTAHKTIAEHLLYSYNGRTMPVGRMMNDRGRAHVLYIIFILQIDSNIIFGECQVK